ncbi:melanocortin-2 receptor accessory protein 2A-like [Thalassophryne amazonica]|uniref:melanocortin-2 receptor accessory protein 2A-like n=1 Tax=Thalassophryne amazonica TaxID=390379 RepID=UPI001470BCC4|nr:melanocortin-2 receptor accessory protein 2A-like [Thalassophryne amazonica]
MSDFHNQSRMSARRSDYVWQYEYYDDEEPVSFEGLKAHRYSIVIGFWVGLAVFVIFMFFVLTLLTKTGAPHQENLEAAEKSNQPDSCLMDTGSHQDENDKAFTRPLLAESHSYFHFYISEEQQGLKKLKPKDQKDGGAQAKVAHDRPLGIGFQGMDKMEDESGRHQLLTESAAESRTNTESVFLSHFNIPNFVNLEHNSVLGEDDLLYVPSAILQ